MDNVNNDVLQNAGNDLSMKYLTFQIADQYYGMSISNVIEIVKIQSATELPGLPYYSKGIINLRGQIIPLIDINLRFGKEERAYTDRTCIIIMDIDGVLVGFIVDAVREVLDVDDALVSPPPTFNDDEASRYVTGIGKLDGYVVLLLDCRRLFSSADIRMLQQAAV